MTTVDLNPGSAPFTITNITGPAIGAISPRPGLSFLGPPVPDGQQITQFNSGVYEMTASSYPYVFLDITGGSGTATLSSTNTIGTLTYPGGSAIIVAAPCFVSATPSAPTSRDFVHTPGGCRIQQIGLTAYTSGDSAGTVISNMHINSSTTVTWAACEADVDWAVPAGMIFHDISTIQALGNSLEPSPPAHYLLERRFLINVDVTTLGSASSLPINFDDQLDVGYQVTFGPGSASFPGSPPARWTIGNGDSAQFSNPLSGTYDEIAIPSLQFGQGVDGDVEQWWTIVVDPDDPPPTVGGAYQFRRGRRAHVAGARGVSIQGR